MSQPKRQEAYVGRDTRYGERMGWGVAGFLTRILGFGETRDSSWSSGPPREPCSGLPLLSMHHYAGPHARTCALRAADMCRQPRA